MKQLMGLSVDGHKQLSWGGESRGHVEVREEGKDKKRVSPTTTGVFVFTSDVCSTTVTLEINE